MTKEKEILILLSDGRWHSARELTLKVSHRFGGYLFTLKEKGIEWEKRQSPENKSWWEYRMPPKHTLF